VIAFAVAVTGLATLLNGALGCHIAIEGTEAPADTRGGIILLCLALTIFLFCLPFTFGRLARLLTAQKLLVIVYLAFAVAFNRLTRLFWLLTKTLRTSMLKPHLSRGDAAFFREAQNLQALKNQEREWLFAETIRHKRTDIARLVAPTLNNLNGAPESPNASLAAYTANAEILEMLIDRGADLSYREPLTGAGLIHQIVSGAGKPADQLRCLSLLKKRKMLDANAVADFGTTPLMIAAERGSEEVVKLLIANGADVNIADKVGSTALHKACDKTIVYPDTPESARLVVAKLLMRAGADARQKNQLGQDCASLAASSGFRLLAAEFGQQPLAE
jgi:hypothetical protein